jgi:hypothetical protein
VIAGTTDLERGDRGAAVAIERGAKSETDLDQFAGVSERPTLTSELHPVDRAPQFAT